MEPKVARALRGAAVGLLFGLLLLFVSLVLLVSRDTPEEIVGVFVPLTVAQLFFALTVRAAFPAFFGDVPRTVPIMAWAFRGIALGGFAIAVVGVVVGAMPWILFAVLPLAMGAALVTDSFRMIRGLEHVVLAESHPDQEQRPYGRQPG